MPHFVLHCLDHPGMLEVRMATRPAHLEYVKAHGALVALAGPLLDADGALCGSCFVLDAPDRDAVDAFVAGDPYVAAGLFGSVTVHVFKPVIGDWAPV
ncbi:MAG: YciI family protein [Hyphomonadaceae bacterium]|nr:YciI family protein [Hyphomonadaceae bacterium]